MGKDFLKMLLFKNMYQVFHQFCLIFFRNFSRLEEKKKYFRLFLTLKKSAKRYITDAGFIQIFYLFLFLFSLKKPFYPIPIVIKTEKSSWPTSHRPLNFGIHVKRISAVPKNATPIKINNYDSSCKLSFF